MDLDASPYRAFIAIVEEHSFSRAAERLNVSQPALSARIREFERQLGFSLFKRTSRRVELSAQGRQFLGNARRMVMETDSALRAARAIETNQLTIGASLQTLLIPARTRLVEGFQALRPDISLRIINDTDSRLLGTLVRREIELALLIEPMLGDAVVYSPLDPASTSGTELERSVLGRRPVLLLLPAEHPAAAWPIVPATALAGMKIAIFDRTYGIALTSTITRHLAGAGADLVRAPERNALAVERYAAVIRTAAMSLGWFNAAHLSGTAPMVSRPIEGLEAATALSLLRLRGEERAAAHVFWEMAKATGEHFHEKKVE